ncbi:MAG: amidohydrolase [Lachnospiraceae bacterium]|nr:amidohydrolase [Lachnospiraceae bacterium]
MDFRIKNGTLLLSENEGLAVVNRELFVEDGRISFSGKEGKNYEEVDAKDRLVMPGLVNMHTHAYMTLMRNYADDVDFEEWLFKRCMPVEDRLPAEGAYWASLLAIEEMIRTGTTCFNDMHMFRGQSARAALDAGMRAVIGRGLVGEDLETDGRSRFEEMLSEQAEYGGGLAEFVIAPHAIYSCSEKLLVQLNEEAKKRGMLKHIHLSESVNEVENCLKARGKTPVEFLSDIGFLDDRTILAHCVQMRGRDIALIRESGATVVTNPASNAKLGNGFAPIREFLEAGVNVCLGTDGTASNNTLNMFREMGLLSIIHKGLNLDSTAAPAEQVIRMATENAGRALKKPGRIGALKEGAAADLIFLDLTEPSMFPANNPVSALCYSANGSEVSSVMIDGKFVMKDRRMLTIDTERTRFEVQKIADRYL